MADIAESIRGALEAHASDLANAATPDAVDQLVPGIVRDAERRYDPRDDPWAYKAVIIILGLVVVAVAITYAWYTLTPGIVGPDGKVVHKLHDLPDAFIALGSAAVGALAGLLAPAPRN